jgi:glucosamine--fructose-6-phosphate aminotransferase (isomerizing)
VTEPGSLMAAEMAEQPQVLAALAGRRAELADRLRPLFGPDHAGTVVVARGSSDNAATCGRYMLEMATGRPVASSSPSIHVLYEADVDFTGYVVIGVSQSGRTPEITAVLERAGAAGARTIAVTNDGDSPLAEAASLVIALGAGTEEAVPATKTVTAEIVAFALIAEAVGPIGVAEHEWTALPSQIASVLGDSAHVSELAAWVGRSGRLAVVARGLLYGAAAEFALKIEETTGVFATAFSAADLRHGPIALAASGLPVIALVHPGPAAADVLELVEDLRARGASVQIAGPVPGAALGWPAEAPEALASLLAVVRGQQVALELSRQLGVDADAPAGLTKVTPT